MARYSVRKRATGAGSTTLPMGSLYAAASVGGVIREIGVFNTTTGAVALAICRLSSAGTSSAITDAAKWDPNSPSPSCTPRDVHSSTGPTIGNYFQQFSLGAAIGSGIILTYGDSGLIIPTGTGNGIGIICPVGTPAICDWYITWDE